MKENPDISPDILYKTQTNGLKHLHTVVRHTKQKF